MQGPDSEQTPTASTAGNYHDYRSEGNGTRWVVDTLIGAAGAVALRLTSTRPARLSLRDLRLRLKDYSLTGAAVHHNANGFSEPQVPDTSLFFYGWLFRQPLPIDGTFASVRIHREITDLECG